MIDKQTFINALKDGLPTLMQNDDDASRAVDVVFSVVSKGLKNRDLVEIHGVGEFRTEPEKGRKRIIFTPARTLLDAVNE